MTKESDKKIVILHNFDRGEYVQLVKSIDLIGLSDKTIVAVTTPTTLEWKLKDLIDELVLEDEEINKQKKK